MVWDCQGYIVRILAGPLDYCDSTKAKVIGSSWVFVRLKFSGFLMCVEGDSMVAIGWGLIRSYGYWKYAN